MAKKLLERKTRATVASIGKKVTPLSEDPKATHFLQTPDEVSVDFDTPSITLSKEAYLDILLFVAHCEYEISWLGEVKREGNDFIISKVHLLKQECSSVTTKISEEGRIDLISELSRSPDAKNRINSLKFWGHSHVEMTVGPSAQDLKQIRNCLEEGGGVIDWYIMGIFNKLGDVRFDIYMKDFGFQFHNVPWRLAGPEYTPDRQKNVLGQIKNLVSAKQYSTAYPHANYPFSGNTGYHPRSHFHDPKPEDTENDENISLEDISNLEDELFNENEY